MCCVCSRDRAYGACLSFGELNDAPSCEREFPRRCSEALRALGHDVAWIRTEAPGSTDIDVMARASREDRILVTLDKDFGELAFRNQLETCSGIVLLRVFPPIPARVTALATQVFESGRDFSRLFVVAEVGRIRERPLPNLARGKPPQEE